MIQKIASTLKEWAESKLDWLENMSVVEFEEIFVITYFVRSHSTSHYLVIRASVVPESAHAVAVFPSIRSIWPMGDAMEREASELFGIHFKLDEDSKNFRKNNLLPEGWTGFPLRKNYVFPKEFLGITHARPTHLMSQKKSF